MEVDKDFGHAGFVAIVVLGDIELPTRDLVGTTTAAAAVVSVEVAVAFADPKDFVEKIVAFVAFVAATPVMELVAIATAAGVLSARGYIVAQRFVGKPSPVSLTSRKM